MKRGSLLDMDKEMDMIRHNHILIKAARRDNLRQSVDHPLHSQAKKRFSYRRIILAPLGSIAISDKRSKSRDFMALVESDKIDGRGIIVMPPSAFAMPGIHKGEDLGGI